MTLGPEGLIRSRLKAEGSRLRPFALWPAIQAPQAGPQLSNLKSFFFTAYFCDTLETVGNWYFMESGDMK